MTNTNELIVYSNSRNGLGIQILGAKYATNKSGIFVKRLLEDGVARKDGRLMVGDQILSINDERAIGISRKQAIQILRSAAATNQVRLHVQHFFPLFSSKEYQQLLYDERSTDDEKDFHKTLHHSLNKNTTNYHNTSATTENEVRMRRSTRRHRREQEQQQYRHSASNLPVDMSNYDEEQNKNAPTLKGLDVSNDALQSLLNSKFKLIDLVDLLKKIYPQLLSNDQKKELRFIQHLSETNKDGCITLKDFERQTTILLGERINLLSPFCSSSTRSSIKSDNQFALELHREIALFRSKIEELQAKIITCEKSQRLSEQVENEYEDLLKFVYEQLNKYKLNEINQLKQMRANHQLIEKLFNYLSVYISQSRDQNILLELRNEYEQQQKFSSSTYQDKKEDTFNLSHKKYRQHT